MSGHIYLYGPPGSGKTTLGKLLAEALALPFIDLDEEIEKTAGRSIPAIMQAEGEPAFRDLEAAALERASSEPGGVVALGGGALLRASNRQLAESSGRVILLEADRDTLLRRLQPQVGRRPLLDGDMGEKLTGLLSRRTDHYNSFDLRIATSDQDPEAVLWEIQRRLGRFHVKGMGPGYDVIIRRGGLAELGTTMKERGLSGFAVIVADSKVAAHYGQPALDSLSRAGYQARLLSFPAGEVNKSLATVEKLWTGFLESGLDRKSVVIALGGGVTGDLAGFAASTFMRGVAWVGVPTSLLAMVDSSLGGKTGFDLPQGKNLVGSFYPPRLVLADPDVLTTLPEPEFISGLAETIKNGIIADPQLVELCSHGLEGVRANLDEIASRAIAVKIRVILVDPYEKGWRASLNLGHTIGHAIELASGFQLRHGEAVAIGMVAEAALAERMGLADAALAAQIAAVLAGVHLPTEIPAKLDRKAILQAMALDKKKALGRVRFSLPTRIGEVRTGVEIESLDTIIAEMKL